LGLGEITCVWFKQEMPLKVDWHIIEELLVAGKLVELEYEGNMYYMQKLQKDY